MYWDTGLINVGSDCNVIIGENVEHIPNHFLWNSEIQSIHIPPSVTSIGEYAFRGCKGLTSITLPSGITSIGEGAFYNCTGINTVVACMTTPPSIEANVFPNRSSQTLYVPSGCLPNYVTADYWKEFKRIEEPTRINFEDSNVEAICVQNWDTNGDGYLDQIEAYLVTDLGTAFQGKSQITKFNELQYFTGLASLADNVFSGCTNLQSVHLSSSITSIGDNAFKNCSSLTVVANLNNIVTIGEGAFQNCTSLTEAIINANSVESNTFQGCTHLTSVTLGSRVSDIKEGAFRNCTALKSDGCSLGPGCMPAKT